VIEAPPVVEAAGADPAPGRRGARLVLDLLVFPLAMVAAGVGIFVLFGLITAEGKGPADYLDLIRTGDSNRRWQAAYELSRVIKGRRGAASADPRLVGQMVSLFEKAEDDDPRVRRFLALALGRMGEAQAVPVLLDYLKSARDGRGQDPETRVYAVWALGAIADGAAVPELLRLVTDEDPGLRKTAAHALGVFRTKDAVAALAQALGDPVGDVRFNAALALARHGDPAAMPVLVEMMDREQLARDEAVTPAQTEEILLQAIQGAAPLDDARLASRLAELGETDPSLRVRAAARRSLQERAAAAPPGAP
jgi:HEAT repeat protein